MAAESVILELIGKLGQADERTRLRMAQAALAAQDATADADSGEKYLTLREVCQRLRRSASWACRLGLPDRVGLRFGGGRAVYLWSSVLRYLDSAECAARRAELKASAWGRKPKAAAGKAVRA